MICLNDKFETVRSIWKEQQPTQKLQHRLMVSLHHSLSTVENICHRANMFIGIWGEDQEFLRNEEPAQKRDFYCGKARCHITVLTQLFNKYLGAIASSSPPFLLPPFVLLSFSLALLCLLFIGRSIPRRGRGEAKDRLEKSRQGEITEEGGGCLCGGKTGR